MTWDATEKSVILTKSDGTKLILKKNQTIQFNADIFYGSPQFGVEIIIARIDDFIGYEEAERFWGIQYSVLKNSAWKSVPKNENNLSDIHYNEDIWNSIFHKGGVNTSLQQSENMIAYLDLHI